MIAPLSQTDRETLEPPVLGGARRRDLLRVDGKERTVGEKVALHIYVTEVPPQGGRASKELSA